MKNQSDLVIFYDGDCGACSHLVSILLKYKNKKPFHLAAIQSETAEKSNFNKSIDSIIYKEGLNYFYYSDAIFKTLSHLKSPFKLFIIFKILPNAWLIYLYKAFAKRRKLFFKKKNCRLISEKDKTLFLP